MCQPICPVGNRFIVNRKWRKSFFFSRDAEGKVGSFGFFFYCRRVKLKSFHSRTFAVKRDKPFFQCVPLPGLGFRRGSYKCVCRRGFYFPDVKAEQRYYNGTIIEEEYEKLIMVSCHVLHRPTT